ncbi:odontogenesis associated phosphoprotein [Mastomys coucha]|uniref:odontogenesis associated phosphoprotein n=1 Tax=Mastomys coucha TaxID=35658 RepID=UPI0012629F06|nr:odontogenesis associated phosphoprotein [Mastomys coucha]
MAPGFHFSWLLVGWLVVTMAEGQDVVTPPGGSQNNVNPTDCQIFTFTPPPTTRNLATRAQPGTRTPTFYFPPRRPGFFYPRFPFFLPNSRRFQFRPFYPPRGRLTPWRLFLGRRLRSGSSSEESTEK